MSILQLLGSLFGSWGGGTAPTPQNAVGSDDRIPSPSSPSKEGFAISSALDQSRQADNEKGVEPAAEQGSDSSKSTLNGVRGDDDMLSCGVAPKFHDSGLQVISLGPAAGVPRAKDTDTQNLGPREERGLHQDGTHGSVVVDKSDANSSHALPLVMANIRSSEKKKVKKTTLEERVLQPLHPGQLGQSSQQTHSGFPGFQSSSPTRQLVTHQRRSSDENQHYPMAATQARQKCAHAASQAEILPLQSAEDVLEELRARARALEEELDKLRRRRKEHDASGPWAHAREHEAALRIVANAEVSRQPLEASSTAESSGHDESPPARLSPWQRLLRVLSSSGVEGERAAAAALEGSGEPAEGRSSGGGTDGQGTSMPSCAVGGEQGQTSSTGIDRPGPLVQHLSSAQQPQHGHLPLGPKTAKKGKATKANARNQTQATPVASPQVASEQQKREGQVAVAPRLCGAEGGAYKQKKVQESISVPLETAPLPPYFPRRPRLLLGEAGGIIGAVRGGGKLEIFKSAATMGTREMVQSGEWRRVAEGLRPGDMTKSAFGMWLYPGLGKVEVMLADPSRRPLRGGGVALGGWGGLPGEWLVLQEKSRLLRNYESLKDWRADGTSAVFCFRDSVAGAKRKILVPLGGTLRNPADVSMLLRPGCGRKMMTYLGPNLGPPGHRSPGGASAHPQCYTAMARARSLVCACPALVHMRGLGHPGLILAIQASLCSPRSGRGRGGGGSWVRGRMQVAGDGRGLKAGLRGSSRAVHSMVALPLSAMAVLGVQKVPAAVTSRGGAINSSQSFGTQLPRGLRQSGSCCRLSGTGTRMAVLIESPAQRYGQGHDGLQECGEPPVHDYVTPPEGDITLYHDGIRVGPFLIFHENHPGKCTIAVLGAMRRQSDEGKEVPAENEEEEDGRELLEMMVRSPYAQSLVSAGVALLREGIGECRAVIEERSQEIFMGWAGGGHVEGIDPKQHRGIVDKTPRESFCMREAEEVLQVSALCGTAGALVRMGGGEMGERLRREAGLRGLSGTEHKATALPSALGVAATPSPGLEGTQGEVHPGQGLQGALEEVSLCKVELPFKAGPCEEDWSTPGDSTADSGAATAVLPKTEFLSEDSVTEAPDAPFRTTSRRFQGEQWQDLPVELQQGDWVLPRGLSQGARMPHLPTPERGVSGPLSLRLSSVSSGLRLSMALGQGAMAYQGLQALLPRCSGSWSPTSAAAAPAGLAGALTRRAWSLGRARGDSEPWGTSGRRADLESGEHLHRVRGPERTWGSGGLCSGSGESAGWVAPRRQGFLRAQSLYAGRRDRGSGGHELSPVLEDEALNACDSDSLALPDWQCMGGVFPAERMLMGLATLHLGNPLGTAQGRLGQSGMESTLTVPTVTLQQQGLQVPQGEQATEGALGSATSGEPTEGGAGEPNGVLAGSPSAGAGMPEDAVVDREMEHCCAAEMHPTMHGSHLSPGAAPNDALLHLQEDGPRADSVAAESECSEFSLGGVGGSALETQNGLIVSSRADMGYCPSSWRSSRSCGRGSEGEAMSKGRGSFRFLSRQESSASNGSVTRGLQRESVGLLSRLLGNKGAETKSTVHLDADVAPDQGPAGAGEGGGACASTLNLRAPTHEGGLKDGGLEEGGLKEGGFKEGTLKEGGRQSWTRLSEERQAMLLGQSLALAMRRERGSLEWPGPQAHPHACGGRTSAVSQGEGERRLKGEGSAGKGSPRMNEVSMSTSESTRSRTPSRDTDYLSQRPARESQDLALLLPEDPWGCARASSYPDSCGGEFPGGRAHIPSGPFPEGGSSLEALAGAGNHRHRHTQSLVAAEQGVLGRHPFQREGHGFFSGVPGPGHGPRPCIGAVGSGGHHVLGVGYADVHRVYEMVEGRGMAPPGQFGIVMPCVHRATGEVFACKTIHKHHVLGPHGAQALRNEVRCLNAVRGHPSICRLHEAYEDPEAVHLVLEWCEGGDLLEHVTRRGCLGEVDAAWLCLQLAQALAFCHARGIVHRDVKCENILLAREGALWSVKLADFGSATFCQPGQPLHGPIGTLACMAPEVLQGAYGPKADVWGLGVVLFSVICGCHPFGSNRDREALLKAIVRGEACFGDLAWCLVSPACSKFVALLLTKDPERRPSAAAILDHPWLVNTLQLSLNSPVHGATMFN